MEKTNLVMYDFVEANPSREARESFYEGVKALEEGNYWEAGIAFANYKTDNFDFDAKIPSYFHRQVVEGQIDSAIKSLNENDFYNAETSLELVENYLKIDAKDFEKRGVYLKNIEKLKKNIEDHFTKLGYSLKKEEIQESNELDFCVNNFDKFYELADFEDDSAKIGLEPLKKLDREINTYEGIYLVDNNGFKKKTFGKTSLENRLN